jgi:hypothetical protein
MPAKKSSHLKRALDAEIQLSPAVKGFLRLGLPIDGSASSIALQDLCATRARMRLNSSDPALIAAWTTLLLTNLCSIAAR